MYEKKGEDAPDFHVFAWKRKFERGNEKFSPKGDTNSQMSTIVVASIR